MKILFIKTDIGTKQYHLASALTDKFGFDCSYATLYPKHFNWRKALKAFPNPKPTLRSFIYFQAFGWKAMLEQENHHPFSSIEVFNQDTIENIDPDLIYVSSMYNSEINLNKMGDKPILLDVEDSQIFRKGYINDKALLETVTTETKLINHPNVKIITFGSTPERDEANIRLSPEKPFLTLYPYVARRTIPKQTNNKTDQFSAVYAGSHWIDAGYRDYRDIFFKILEQGIELTVFMTNSHHKRNYNALKRIEAKYPNFHLYKFTSFGKIKEKISKYHVGISGNVFGYTKTEATFGMKSLEYAYANVQPVTSGHPITNLTDKREFGYYSKPEFIEENYQNNLVNFDYNGHIMDNNIDFLIWNINNILNN